MYKYILKNSKFTLFIIMAIISAILGTGFSFIMSHLIDLAGEGTSSKLIMFVFFAISYVVFTVLCEYIYTYTKYYLLMGVRINVKNDLFEAVIGKDIADFERKGRAFYLSQMTTKTDMLSEQYIKNILSLPYLVCSFTSAIIACIILNWVMLVIMLVLGLLTVHFTNIFGKRIEDKSEKLLGLTSGYTQRIKDYLDGFIIVKSFNAERQFNKEFENINSSLEKARIDSSKAMMHMSYSGELVGLLSTVLVTGIAAFFALNGLISVGSILAFSQLMGKISSPISSAVDIKAGLKASVPIVRELEETLSSVVKTTNDLDELDTDISFKDVSFTYEKNDVAVLNSCSFEIKGNKKILITGDSGAGKTTIMKLLLKYYDYYLGSIKVGNRNLKELTTKSIFHKIGYLSQDPFVFEDTIRNNISMYDESIPIDQINVSLIRSGLRKLVDSLPNGLDTMVTELGSNLSGGEKQRICLARLFLFDKDIIILDEFENGLDNETKIFIESSILELEDKMIICISHDQSEQHKQKYDIIYTMRDGKLFLEGV